MFSLLRVSIGERKGTGSQVLRHTFFIGMSIFFFLAEFLCLHLKKKNLSFHTWQAFLCLGATCHPPSVFFMQLVPRTRRVTLYVPHRAKSFPQSSAERPLKLQMR